MFAQNLYNDLMKLVKEENSAFYCVDQFLDGVFYRVFSYRLANYTEFCKPNALECRGHMFEVTESGEFIRLASLPMFKFFNYLENPMTMNLDLSLASMVMDKHDGSLISTYNHKGQLKLKSKTSLTSEQAKAAMNLLESNKFKNLYNFCDIMEYNNYTVNLEYEAPENRIVLAHNEDKLTVLNVRDKETGEYLKYASLKALMQQYKCENHLVRNIAENIQDYSQFIASVAAMTGIEGFVVCLADGTYFKIKTDWYCNLHGLKDNVNSTKKLFECVVSEASDDLRAQFHDDEYIINKVNNMEIVVRAISNEFNENVYGFYNENKQLDRKSYAILAQATLPKLYFGSAMNVYLGKEINVKEWMIKNYTEFALKDDVVVVE